MQHLLLLHGAAGAKEQLAPLANVLNKEFTVHLVNFSGHGGRPMPVSRFSMELFAEDVFNYMQENNIGCADFFGYSMGGYVAMYLAKHHPEKINRIITLATKFYWDEATAAKEIKMLDAATIQQKVPAFAEQLRSRHLPNSWSDVLEKTIAMLTSLGKKNTLNSSDYLHINSRCLIVLGDRDKMVTLGETVAVYKQVPNAQLCVLPNTPHPIEQVNADLLSFFIKRHLTAET
jgi:pimeloyl-ACP methyl ester carboxylesterase